MFFLLLGYSEILWGYTKWKETCNWNSKEEWENKVCWRNFKSKERNKGNQGQFSKYNIELYKKWNSFPRLDMLGAWGKYRFQLTLQKKKKSAFLINIADCILCFFSEVEMEPFLVVETTFFESFVLRDVGLKWKVLDFW